MRKKSVKTTAKSTEAITETAGQRFFGELIFLWKKGNSACFLDRLVLENPHF